MTAIKNNESVIDTIRHPTLEMYLAIIKKDGYAMKYAKQNKLSMFKKRKRNDKNSMNKRRKTK